MSPCPYCSLLCFPNQLGGIDHCPRRKSDLTASRDAAAAVASVEGKATEFSSALNACVKCLADATHVLMTGRISSLETSREVLKLARLLDAYVDLSDSNPMFDWIQSVQETGCVTTTISEARYRSDLIVVIQLDEVLEDFPLVLEQLLRHPDKLSTQTKLMFVNAKKVEMRELCDADLCGQVSEAITLEVSENDLYSLFKACASKTMKDVSIDHIGKAQTLRSALEAANYPVIVFSTSLAVRHQRTIYALLHQLASELGVLNRIHLLPLQSSNLQFSQACTWQTGFPGRIHFIDGVAIYGPSLFSANQVKLEHASSLTTLTLNESVTNASVVIKNRNTEIYIPIARAGVENSATLMKADGSIMLNIQGDESQKSASEVLLELRKLLDLELRASL